MEAASPKYTGNLLGRAFRHCSQWGSLQSGLLYYYQLLALVLLGSTEQAVCSIFLRWIRSVMAAYSATPSAGFSPWLGGFVSWEMFSDPHIVSWIVLHGLSPFYSPATRPW